MNDFDRGARYAVKHGPAETRSWLFPRLAPRLRYGGWLDSQSAPRPGEPDRRCDTIVQLVDEQELTPPWACVIELFTEADADAIDRPLEYVARFRRELRHGPHGRDRYPFAVALVFLTKAPGETRLDMNLPGMEEVGLWFGPRVLDLSQEDAVAHLDAIEHNKLGRWLLVWTPLMKGGNTIEVARRWRTLAEPDPRLSEMALLADTFARLTECEGVWRDAMEGINMKTSPLWDEAREEGRQEERVKLTRKHTRGVLEARFPGQVPAAVIERINVETDFAKLERWHTLASTATLEKFQQGMD
jgi:hypothetical protein